MLTEHTAVELTGSNQPGLLFEISVVLAELQCRIASAVVWTHNGRAACVIYIEDEASPGGPITDPERLACVEERLENVVEGHRNRSERLSVRLTAPTAGRTHTERRLHQLMLADKDYEQCSCSCSEFSRSLECAVPHVSIEVWKEKGYSVVNIKSRDRPKLLFDTVCVLTDMGYVVSHAVIKSEGNMADQVKQKKTITLLCYSISFLFSDLVSKRCLINL